MRKTQHWPISLVTLERPGEENPSGIIWNASQQQVKSVVKEEPQRKTSKITFEPFGGTTSVPPVSLVEQEALPQQEGGGSRLISTPLRDPSQRREMPAASSLQLVIVPREPSQRREHARQQPPPVAVTVDVSSDTLKKATGSKDKRATVMPSRKISFRSFRKAARCPSYMTRRSLTNTLYSPIGAVLLVCVFTFLWCLAEIISPPPFGLNTGWNGGGTGCNGTDSQPLDICICPRETVCVKDVKSLVFLAFARLSAYFDYPLYVLLFASKAHNLHGALYRTHLREFLPLDDLRHLHTFAGAEL